MNKEKLRSCFSQTLGIPIDRVTDDLAYNTIEEWDSVGHMAVVADIESTFDVMLDTDDILNLSSVGQAVAILRKLGVDFDAA
jgi:acyl carrier protein